MSQLLCRRLLRLSLGKLASSSVRSSLLPIFSNGFSSSLRQTPPSSNMDARRCGEGLEVDYSTLLEKNKNQTPPYAIIAAYPCGKVGLRKLEVHYADRHYEHYCDCHVLEKKAPMELFSKDSKCPTVGSSHGWIATLKEDGILRLQDDLNLVASDTNPKRIPLPPLVTLPHCQTQIVTNMAMSSPSPEDEDCVVAIKFLGPQLSFCRPAQSNSEWTNIRIENPCFFSSQVMYSKKDDMFKIPGSGGHLIGSWDPPRTPENKPPRFQKLRITNFPELTQTECELLTSCCTTDHLVESRPTGETFLVKWYRKAYEETLKTETLMVFRLDAKGNAIYTQDIGDLCIFLSRSEPFCVPVASVGGFYKNTVKMLDDDEIACFYVDDAAVGGSWSPPSVIPYFFPPQNRDL